LVSQSFLIVLIVVDDLCHCPNGGEVSVQLGVEVVFGHGVVVMVIVVVVVVESDPR